MQIDQTFIELNKKSISDGKKSYIDPKTGYSVFNSEELKKRPCCGNGCRHCPYGVNKGSKIILNW